MNRLSKLVDEEIEADEEFWGQEAFKEVRIYFSVLLFSTVSRNYHCMIFKSRLRGKCSRYVLFAV